MSYHVTPQSWMADALCAQSAPDLWFPEHGTGNEGATTSVKAICRACDVQTECLAFALANDEQHGIWAATTPRQRQRVRRAAA